MLLLLLGFAFLAGLATILAPCVWPILPVVLSSSVSGGKRRPLGISLGVVISFAAFTLTASYLVRLFNFDPIVFRYLAVFVITFLGFSMIIPKLSEMTELLVSRLSSVWGTTGQNQNSGFLGGFVTGLSLGIVWSPCAGPILAAIAALSATGQVNSAVVFITIAYSLGAGVPLFILALSGQKLLSKITVLSPYTPLIQKAFGILMIAAALAILTNFDKTLSVNLLNAFPKLGAFSTSFEENQFVNSQLDNLQGKVGEMSSGLSDARKAPDFVGITKWLNTEKPLTIEDLKGKVVLVDFWTYTCINCIRTLPHVTSWYDKYKNKGFVVIGVHTPEFEFEKNTDNVLSAIKQYNIHYPVAQDNNYETWRNYNNRYWPAKYLIDGRGQIRKTHFGEGEYDEMEKAIQDLLKEAGQNVEGGVVEMPDETPKQQITPETYLGSTRMEYYYPSGQIGKTSGNFKLDDNLVLNSFSLGGNFSINEDYIQSGDGAVLQLYFRAKKVFLVLRPPESGVIAKIKVTMDGKSITSEDEGVEVKDGIVSVSSDKLYSLVDLKSGVGNHKLRLEFLTPGTKAFVFTFGS